jgi:phosphoribosylanthranilate isomerase
MFVKVCGMKDALQIEQLDEVAAFIGFIFYEKSPRYVEVTRDLKHAQKVGVFVNAPIEDVQSKIQKHRLDYVQLHGNESPEYCKTISSIALVIKAFGIDTITDFKATLAYSEIADYFLFDTKTSAHGGSGKKFDWQLLHAYSGKNPFILSGGICPDSLDAILEINHPQLAGIDLNSGFELSPANKDIHTLKTFIDALSNRSVYTA